MKEHIEGQKPNKNIERRQFLRSSCNLCLLGISGVLFAQLPACSPAAFSVVKADITDNKIQLPLELFAKSPFQVVRPNGWYYDIAVTKKSDDTYQALLLQCTHQDNQLTTTGNGYQCSLHGSVFDKEGQVKKGPASKPLDSYSVTIVNEHILISIPKNHP